MRTLYKLLGLAGDLRSLSSPRRAVRRQRNKFAHRTLARILRRL